MSYVNITASIEDIASAIEDQPETVAELIDLIAETDPDDRWVLEFIESAGPPACALINRLATALATAEGGAA